MKQAIMVRNSTQTRGGVVAAVNEMWYGKVKV